MDCELRMMVNFEEMFTANFWIFYIWVYNTHDYFQVELYGITLKWLKIYSVAGVRTTIRKILLGLGCSCQSELDRKIL